MGLLVTEKAVIVSNGRGVIRTPSTTYLRPSVIRLGYMVRRPRPRVRLTRHEILRRDGYTCQYCGRQGGSLTIDHVVPRHRGGERTWANLVTACQACNRKKGSRLAREMQMRLLRQPHEPPAAATYLYRRYLNGNGGWLTFIEGW
jgi:5-methylcytosine-specific restriction endonuclease McrA